MGCHKALGGKNKCPCQPEDKCQSAELCGQPRLHSKEVAIQKKEAKRKEMEEKAVESARAKKIKAGMHAKYSKKNK